MKIGIDARLLQETGVGRYIRALISNLAELDKTNKYVLFLRSSDLSAALPKNWEKVRADVNWHTLAEQIDMPRLFRAANLDLLHIPYFAVPLFTPRPFIVTIHDLTISHFATGKATTRPLPMYLLKQLGYRWVLANAVKKATRVIVVSETVKQQLCREYRLDPANIAVTYEAGDLEPTRETTAIHTPPNYILYVGNAHPHKNLERLVSAFVIVVKQLPEIKLVCIGKPDYFYQRLKKYVTAQGLEKSIIFPGEVNNFQLATWYQNAAAFVFPSLSEGFGIPGLEAMQNGCPVLASDIPVFREIYGNAAYYFLQTNAPTIAQAIIKVVKDRKIQQRLSQDGKLRARSFSWKKMAQQTLTIYENCLSLRSSK